MDYISQLQTEEWESKRQQIISRDNSKCCICQNKSYVENNNFGVIEFNNPYKILLEQGKIEGIDLNNADTDALAKHAIKTIIYKKTAYIWDYETNSGPYNITKLTHIHILKNLKVDLKRFRLLEEHDSKVAFYQIENNNVTIQAICDLFIERKSTPELIHFEKELKKPRFIKKNITELIPYSDLFISPISKDSIIQKLNSIQWHYTKYLSVHHHYYKRGKLAWEYDNDALISVCWECHEDIHKKNVIPFLDENGKLLKNLTPCSRCSGTGYFPEYSHVQSGICFECNGVKYKDFM